MRRLAGILILAAAPASACDLFRLNESMVECFKTYADRFAIRRARYVAEERSHRLAGLASYYSDKFDGRKTANGEIFRNRRYSAAHLTLPLGTWIEVTSRATGRRLRMRVNDRGPYARKFMLDLSQAAARALGVDKSRDRYVEVRIIGLPGEQPLPDSAREREAERRSLSGGRVD
ncbi:MAG TPA: septal ring lytic transglycosylase RlpA family protein [Thermoanaerobaculia bacterium]|nr:septal ring lytic transglycosylase RlpA family protein [Thermoanaerobaculia bacterium]